MQPEIQLKQIEVLDMFCWEFPADTDEPGKIKTVMCVCVCVWERKSRSVSFILNIIREFPDTSILFGEKSGIDSTQVFYGTVCMFCLYVHCTC